MDLITASVKSMVQAAERSLNEGVMCQYTLPSNNIRAELRTVSVIAAVVVVFPVV